MLDVDDENGAEQYMTDTHCHEVSMEENALSFMMERKLITQEEYASALPTATRSNDNLMTKSDKSKVESWDDMYLNIM